MRVDRSQYFLPSFFASLRHEDSFCPCRSREWHHHAVPSPRRMAKHPKHQDKNKNNLAFLKASSHRAIHRSLADSFSCVHGEVLEQEKSYPSSRTMPRSKRTSRQNCSMSNTPPRKRRRIKSFLTPKKKKNRPGTKPRSPLPKRSRLLPLLLAPVARVAVARPPPLVLLARKPLARKTKWRRSPASPPVARAARLLRLASSSKKTSRAETQVPAGAAKKAKTSGSDGSETEVLDLLKEITGKSGRTASKKKQEEVKQLGKEFGVDLHSSPEVILAFAKAFGIKGPLSQTALLVNVKINRNY